MIFEPSAAWSLFVLSVIFCFMFASASGDAA